MHLVKYLYIALSIGFTLLHNLGAAQLKHNKLAELSASQWLIESFDAAYSHAKPCRPELAPAPPLPGALDAAISELGDLSDHEHAAIKSLFGNDCRTFYTLSSLGDLYFPLFEQKLRSANLNPEFKYLPVLLSGLNAGYEDVNRAGLWGVDVFSARLNQLSITPYIDERKVPERATELAIRMLDFYVAHFEGDLVKTSLAMAFGLPFAQHFDHNQPHSEALFWLSSLKVFIRLYNNTERQQRLGDWLSFFDGYTEFELTDTLKAETCIQLGGTSPEALMAMNPWFRTSTFIPSEHVALVVDTTAYRRMKSAIDSLYTYQPKQVKPKAHLTQTSRRQAETPETYTVKSGDVLGSIARQFGVSVSQLKDWNNLQSDRINIGQKLVVYTPSNARSSSVRNAQNEPAQQTRLPASSQKEVVHTVREGESLWVIARNYPGVSAEDIMRWNGIDERIVPGTELKIIIP